MSNSFIQYNILFKTATKQSSTMNAIAMLLQSRDWYREMKIQLHNSSRAARLDLDNHLVGR